MCTILWGHEMCTILWGHGMCTILWGHGMCTILCGHITISLHSPHTDHASRRVIQGEGAVDFIAAPDVGKSCEHAPTAVESKVVHEAAHCQSQ